MDKLFVWLLMLFLFHGSYGIPHSDITVPSTGHVNILAPLPTIVPSNSAATGNTNPIAPVNIIGNNFAIPNSELPANIQQTQPAPQVKVLATPNPPPTQAYQPLSLTGAGPSKQVNMLDVPLYSETNTGNVQSGSTQFILTQPEINTGRQQPWAYQSRQEPTFKSSMSPLLNVQPIGVGSLNGQPPTVDRNPLQTDPFQIAAIGLKPQGSMNPQFISDQYFPEPVITAVAQDGILGAQTATNVAIISKDTHNVALANIQQQLLTTTPPQTPSVPPMPNVDPQLTIMDTTTPNIVVINSEVTTQVPHSRPQLIAALQTVNQNSQPPSNTEVSEIRIPSVISNDGLGPSRIQGTSIIQGIQSPEVFTSPNKGLQPPDTLLPIDVLGPLDTPAISNSLKKTEALPGPASLGSLTPERALKPQTPDSYANVASNNVNAMQTISTQILLTSNPAEVAQPRIETVTSSLPLAQSHPNTPPIALKQQPPTAEISINPFIHPVASNPLPALTEQHGSNNSQTDLTINTVSMGVRYPNQQTPTPANLAASQSLQNVGLPSQNTPLTASNIAHQPLAPINSHQRMHKFSTVRQTTNQYPNAALNSHLNRQYQSPVNTKMTFQQNGQRLIQGIQPGQQPGTRPSAYPRPSNENLNAIQDALRRLPVHQRAQLARQFTIIQNAANVAYQSNSPITQNMQSRRPTTAWIPYQESGMQRSPIVRNTPMSTIRIGARNKEWESYINYNPGTLGLSRTHPVQRPRSPIQRWMDGSVSIARNPGTAEAQYNGPVAHNYLSSLSDQQQQASRRAVPQYRVSQYRDAQSSRASATAQGAYNPISQRLRNLKDNRWIQLLTALRSAKQGMKIVPGNQGHAVNLSSYLVSRNGVPHATKINETFPQTKKSRLTNTHSQILPTGPKNHIFLSSGKIRKQLGRQYPQNPTNRRIFQSNIPPVSIQRTAYQPMRRSGMQSAMQPRTLLRNTAAHTIPSGAAMPNSGSKGNNDMMMTMMMLNQMQGEGSVALDTLAKLMPTVPPPKPTPRPTPTLQRISNAKQLRDRLGYYDPIMKEFIPRLAIYGPEFMLPKPTQTVTTTAVPVTRHATKSSVFIQALTVIRKSRLNAWQYIKMQPRRNLLREFANWRLSMGVTNTPPFMQQFLEFLKGKIDSIAPMLVSMPQKAVPF